jgi:hypothetical protein
MSRNFVVVALAALLSSPVVMAEGPQAKPAQRPATKKPAPAKPVEAPAPKPEPPPPPGVKLTTAFTQGAQVSENTTYLQGARQRVEFPGVVTLDQCDLKRTVLLNTAAKRYRVQPYPADSEPAKPAAAEPLDPQAAQMAEMAKMMGQAPKPQQRGGVVTFTTTLSDTLERQQMFGLEARRIKTTVLKQSSNSACDKSPLKIEIDAWYVDLPAQSACARPSSQEPAPAADPNACTDTIEARAVGDVRLGFPIKLTTITTTGEGNKTDSVTSSQEVTALEVARLDTVLFDVPKDYVEASSTAEIVPSIAKGGSLAEALFGSTADGTSTAAPKKPGTIRIGVLQPLNKVARDLPATGLREDLVSKFKSGYEAIPLSGNSAAAVEADAVRLQCDFVMVTEIVEAKTSKPGKLGGLTKIAGGGPPKDSHDVKVDYKLFAVGASQTAKASGNVKASNGGFGIGSALRIAAFAGQMYMSLMMGGMGMGMMNPMMAMSQMGGLGTMGGGLFDPRASAMTSMMSSFGSMGSMGGMGGGAMSDPSEAGMRDTLSEAMANSARSAMEQLGKKK